MSKKTLSEDDSNLFRQSIGQVKIIESDTVLLKKERKTKPISKSQNDGLNNSFKEFPILSEQLHAEDSMSFLTAGLQKSVLKKMRRGDFGLDAELDLHGLNSHEAKQYLQRFLDDCVEDGCRCVHVIHGKGYRSEGSFPVLKNNVNIWLRQHNEVQAFCSAAPKDGGTGAVLVLLHLTDKYRL